MIAPTRNSARVKLRHIFTTLIGYVLIFTLAQSSTAWADPSVVGEWSVVQDWPTASIHSNMLPTGKVLFYIRQADPPLLFDPETEAITPAANPGLNLFCSGHSFLADGRVLTSGGHLGSVDGFGLKTATIYDPFNDTWTSVPDMNAGRWYPSSTTLANGDVLVTSGRIDKDVRNDLPQVYEAATGTWRDLTDAVLTQLNYPRTFLAPNGKVFVATKHSRYLDTSGTGSWSSEFATHLVGGRDNYGVNFYVGMHKANYK